MKRTREELVEEIMRLEIECSKLEEQAGGNIYESNLFNEYLKLSRKVQKLQNQL